MQISPRVRGSTLYLPPTPRFRQAAQLLRLPIEQREFKDSPMPAWFIMDFTPEHVRALNKIVNAQIPGPAFAAWPYGGMHTPYMHQRFTVDFLTQNPRCFCFNDMGTGKTSSVLWATEYLRDHGEVGRTLIFSPLSTLKAVWGNEMFNIRPNKTVVIAHGSRLKREDAFFGDAQYVATNHDAIRLIEPKRLAEAFDHIVVDELGVFRTWSSGGMPTRYKNMYALAHHPNVKRFWGLTGTPTPNSPFDAWALIRLVDPKFRVPKTTFQMEIMRQLSEYKWIPKPNATERVRELMQPSIRFAKEDVLKDLPPLVYTTRDVDLSKEQRAMRDTLRKEHTTEHKGQTITAVNAAVLLNKLLQVSAGVVKSDGDPVRLDYKPKYKALLQLIEQTQGKTLVFCNYTEPLKRLFRDLKKDGKSPAAVWGGVAAGKRATIYEDFQKKDDPKVIVAHPATTAHGITLTAADLIVWFGPVLSNELYEQANARAHRPGQRRTVTVAHICSTPEEVRIYRVLRERGVMQAEILKTVEEIT